VELGPQGGRVALQRPFGSRARDNWAGGGDRPFALRIATADKGKERRAAVAQRSFPFAAVTHRPLSSSLYFGLYKKNASCLALTIGRRHSNPNWLYRQQQQLQT